MNVAVYNEVLSESSYIMVCRHEACPSDGTSPNFNYLLQGPSIFSFLADQALGLSLPRTRDPDRMKIVLHFPSCDILLWFSEVRIRISRFTTISLIGAPPSYLHLNPASRYQHAVRHTFGQLTWR